MEASGATGVLATGTRVDPAEERGAIGAGRGHERGAPSGEGSDTDGPEDAPRSGESVVDASTEGGALDPEPAPGVAVARGVVEAEGEIGAGDALTDEELHAAIAALVFASPEPLSERRLALLLEGPAPERVQAGLESLRSRLEASGLPYELRAIAGGWQILTRSELGPVVQKLFKARKAERISSAALETLSVVAYRQPVTKAEIEAIRGVQAGPVLRSLIDKGLVRIAGRADVPGHPLQYGTTRAFLDRFGLASLADLPRDSELAKD